MREESRLKFALLKIVIMTSNALYVKVKTCNKISERPFILQHTFFFKHIYPSNLWLKPGVLDREMGARSLGRAAQASAMEKPHHPQRLPPAPEECLRCHFNAFGGTTL